MGKIKNFFSYLRWSDNATNKKLGLLSIIMVIFFDIFFLVEMWNGIDNQGPYAVRPDLIIPFECEKAYDLLAKPNSTGSDVIQLIEIFNYDYYTKKLDQYKFEHIKYTTNDCSLVFNKVNDFVTRNGDKFNRIRSTNDEIVSAENDVMNFKRQHADYLSELSAWAPNKDRISKMPTNISETYKELTWKVDWLKYDLAAQKDELYRQADIQYLLEMWKTRKESLIQMKEDVVFWYPVKQTLYQMIFVIPVFIITLMLYRLSLRKQYLILKSLSANAAFFSWVHALILLFSLIYWILPKRLLKNIYDWLVINWFVVIWDYLIVVILIAIFGVAIYFIQEWLDARKEIQETLRAKKAMEDLLINRKQNMLNGMCYSCTTVFEKGQQFCLNCWSKLVEKCTNCENEFFVTHDFCDKCWHKRKPLWIK